MKIEILSGLPGCGKSTYVDYRQRDMASQGNRCIVVSTDDFFTKPDGSYAMDTAKIATAHNQCLRQYIWHVIKDGMLSYTDQDLLVVDNTNLTVAEIAPYAAYAQAYEHDMTIIRFMCEPEKAFARQTHGVSKVHFAQMCLREAALTAQLPTWWNVVYEKSF